MATLESDDRNIVEADAVDWRFVAFPAVAVMIVLFGGFGIYYYQLNQRDIQESAARDALVQAKSPDEMVRVADQFPKTTQAAVALISAADASYNAKDYASAMQDYQRAASAPDTPVELRDSAQVGFASSQQASGKSDDAIQSFLKVAQKGDHSAFAPAAYYAIAQIYADRKDLAQEKNILQQTVQLGGDSPFVKAAAVQLRTMSGAPPAGTAAGSENDDASATSTP
jgi:predicted negative regulator of RcsB-dependent stress response